MAKSEFVNSMNSQVIQQPALEFSFLSSSADLLKIDGGFKSGGDF
jgi:hypothetical protein